MVLSGPPDTFCECPCLLIPVLTLMSVRMLLCLTDINRAIELLDKLQRTGEVPPQKLQALQRVLQSEFCNAVREVRCFVIITLKTLTCEMSLPQVFFLVLHTVFGLTT